MMPTTNVRKHITPLGSEVSLTREVLFGQFGESIHDIVPVANVTARAQLVTDLNAKSKGPSAANPLVVYRADAPGMHRIESTVDGTVWVPTTGVLSFASKSAADSFGTAYPGLLTTGDRCLVSGVEYQWAGSWQPRMTPINARATYAGVGGVGNGTPLVTMSFPALPLDTIVDLDALAQVGNTSGAAGTYVPSFSTVGGTISELAMSLYNVAPGQWVNVSKDARLTLPAGTAATVTVAASSTQNGQWNVSLRSSRRSA